MSKIGDYLHEWRIEQNLSRVKLGCLLCCSDRAIESWEKGKRDPSYSCIKMIQEVTGAEWEDLF